MLASPTGWLYFFWNRAGPTGNLFWGPTHQTDPDQKHQLTPPKPLTCPLKRDRFNREIVFQTSFFWGHVSFPGIKQRDHPHLPKTPTGSLWATILWWHGMKPFNVRALHNPLTPSRLLFLFRTTASHIVDDIPLKHWQTFSLHREENIQGSRWYCWWTLHLESTSLDRLFQSGWWEMDHTVTNTWPLWIFLIRLNSAKRKTRNLRFPLAKYV